MGVSYNPELSMSANIELVIYGRLAHDEGLRDTRSRAITDNRLDIVAELIAFIAATERIDGGARTGSGTSDG